MKLLFLLLVVTVYAKHEMYEGYKCYYVTPDNENQLNYLYSIITEFELDVLEPPSIKDTGIIIVKPEYQTAFLKALDEHGIRYKLFIQNLKANLDYDDKLRTENLSSKNRHLPYDNYHEIEVIYKYLQDVAKQNPNLVTLVNAGTSFEKRPLYHLKISTTKFEDKRKPVIFLDGGIHAREWISPPTLTWAIHKLVENVTQPDLLERFDWIILPVVNPDGYKFTFARDRLWRKTRSKSPESNCYGVDANRNFDYNWNTTGSSSRPCDETYCGPSKFSEAESIAVRDILLKYRSRMAMYITIHSYGSMILYPWGDGSSSKNKANLDYIGKEMAKAIYASSIPEFKQYKVGNILDVIRYKVSGSTADYAHFIGVPIAYALELPGTHGGANGFILDPKYIKQVCHETWEGIVVGARKAGDLFKP